MHYFNIASGQTKTFNDVDDFYLYRLYGWNDEEEEKIFKKYGIDIIWNSDPYPDAVEILSSLYRKHKLTFITARPEFCKEITIKWLNRYNIHYHNISFVNDKLDECQKLNVDILIDDAPHYAEEFAALKKPYILFDQPYNQHIDHESVFRARNWKEITEYIESLPTILK